MIFNKCVGQFVCKQIIFVFEEMKTKKNKKKFSRCLYCLVSFFKNLKIKKLKQKRSIFFIQYSR